ncbi:hypothetical protein BJ741DRAFT_662020 [Chytriomyces cf. hyalinus JEL632]|nr:hypothetical protein BJ741DRAFT_662020 [Chytriomyces cf. hyalinus JEL632]
MSLSSLPHEILAQIVSRLGTARDVVCLSHALRCLREYGTAITCARVAVHSQWPTAVVECTDKAALALERVDGIKALSALLRRHAGSIHLNVDGRSNIFHLLTEGIIPKDLPFSLDWRLPSNHDPVETITTIAILESCANLTALEPTNLFFGHRRATEYFLDILSRLPAPKLSCHISMDFHMLKTADSFPNVDTFECSEALASIPVSKFLKLRKLVMCSDCEDLTFSAIDALFVSSQSLQQLLLRRIQSPTLERLRSEMEHHAQASIGISMDIVKVTSSGNEVSFRSLR